MKEAYAVIEEERNKYEVKKKRKRKINKDALVQEDSDLEKQSRQVAIWRDSQWRNKENFVKFL